MQHVSGLFRGKSFPALVSWRKTPVRLGAPHSYGEEQPSSEGPQRRSISRTRRSLQKKIQALQIFRHAHPHARASSSDWILQNVHLTENNEVGHCNMELLRVLPTDVVVHGVLLQNTVHTTARTSWNVKGRVTPITNVTKFPQNCTNLLQYRKIFTRTLFLKV